MGRIKFSDTLAWRITSFREAKNLSLQQLAKEAGISYVTLYKIETGDTASPTLEVFVKIARVLGIEKYEDVTERMYKWKRKK